MINCEELKEGSLTGYLFCKLDYRKVTEEYCKRCKEKLRGRPRVIHREENEDGK